MFSEIDCFLKIPSKNMAISPTGFSRKFLCEKMSTFLENLNKHEMSIRNSNVNHHTISRTTCVTSNIFLHWKMTEIRISEDETQETDHSRHPDHHASGSGRGTPCSRNNDSWCITHLRGSCGKGSCESCGSASGRLGKLS